MREQYELMPIYDNKASFYQKAIVEIENGRKTLFSYNTRVAYIDDNGAHVINTYSATTLRHIREFLRQNGFRTGTSKELMALYGV